MVVPAVIFGGGLVLALARARPKARGLAALPAVKWYFQRILDARLPPAEFRRAAAEFARLGYTEEARVLRKRADYGELPLSVRQEHGRIAEQALTSQNAEAIRAVAANLREQGAVGNAARLVQHARAVEAAQRTAPISVPPPPPASAAPAAQEAAAAASTPASPPPSAPAAEPLAQAPRGAA